jgi:hypothetical protein
MKGKNFGFLFLGIIVLAILALFLQNFIQREIILPIIKLIWIIKGYYGASLQVAYWVFALTIAALIAIFSFHMPDSYDGNKKEKPKPGIGPVQELSFWIQRAKSSVFPKWHVAHLLAELALDLSNQRRIHSQSSKKIIAPDWKPPENVRKYLEAAMASDYQNFKNLKRGGPIPSTLIDQDLEPVVKYFESYLENEDDHNS